MSDLPLDPGTVGDVAGQVGYFGGAGFVVWYLLRTHRVATATLNELNDRLNTTAKSAEARTVEVITQRDDAQDEAARLRSQVASLTSTVDHLERVVQARDDQIAALRERLRNRP